MNQISTKYNQETFPPYSKVVQLNIEKYFMCLIDKHYLLTHKFRKTFSPNKTKIIHSRMSNMRPKSVHITRNYNTNKKIKT